MTGSDDEASFGPWLAAELDESADFGTRREIWAFPVAEGDARYCVAMLARGSGRRTVILTGHFDTVAIDDYGDLRDLATKPAELSQALQGSLSDNQSAAARLTRTDLANGEFLPGRGLLDMKAGLAAGLAAIAEFSRHADQVGNILFLAVPDEENNSAGARRAAQLLPHIAAKHDLDIVAAINLDAIADDGAGENGRVIALGTVGKLLPTAVVFGTPTHSGFPLNGVNAATLAAAIAAKLEWAPELTERLADGGGTPPSLLSLRDGKPGYDVTTPASAFVTLNVLSYRRTPEDVLQGFERLCREACADVLDMLRARVKQLSSDATPDLPAAIPVHRYASVIEAARERHPDNGAKLSDKATEVAQLDLSLPEKCRQMTEHAWMLSGLPAPAIVSGFGSIPYLPPSLSETANATLLKAVALRTAAKSRTRYGVTITCVDYFAGISDMSFLGEADEASLAVVGVNTPLWQHAVRWPERDGVANVPTINIGPWGRDYHTPFERLYAPYAFDVLPALLTDAVKALLSEMQERKQLLPDA